MPSELKISLRRGLTYTTDTDGFVPCIYVPSGDRNFQYDAAHGFGWDAIFDGSRDRTSSGPSQLCGIHFASSPRYFRLDLPDGAGEYKVYAAGRDGVGTCPMNWDFFDGADATAFHSVSETTTSASDVVEIDGSHTAASLWTPSGNAFVTHTFTNDHMIIKPSSSGAEMSAVWVEASGGPPASVFYNPFKSQAFHTLTGKRIR